MLGDCLLFPTPVCVIFLGLWTHLERPLIDYIYTIRTCESAVDSTRGPVVFDGDDCTVSVAYSSRTSSAQAHINNNSTEPKYVQCEGCSWPINETSSAGQNVVRESDNSRIGRLIFLRLLLLLLLCLFPLGLFVLRRSSSIAAAVAL
jgi:hypothetical protein